MFELPQIDTRTMANRGVRMPLRDLNGDILKHPRHDSMSLPNGGEISLTLAGMDSDRYAEANKAAIRRSLERAEESERGSAKSQVPARLAEVERAREDAIELLVAVTVGWENVPAEGGGLVTFSAEAARAFYKAFPVAFEQADRFIAKRANFTLAR